MQDMFVVLTMTDGERYEGTRRTVKSPGAATMEGLLEYVKSESVSPEMRENGAVVFFGAWPNEIPAEPGGR